MKIDFEKTGNCFDVFYYGCWQRNIENLSLRNQKMAKMADVRDDGDHRPLARNHPLRHPHIHHYWIVQISN